MQLKSGTANLGPALSVRVTAIEEDQDAVHKRPVRPSDDRISLLTDAQRVVRDEVLIGVGMAAPDPDAVAAQAAAVLHASITGSIPGIRLYQLRVPGASAPDLARLAASAEGVADVDFTALNYVEFSPGTDTVPNDPDWDDWDLASPAGNNWSMEWVKAPIAWDVETGGSGVRIAVIDSGFDPHHGDLRNNVSRDVVSTGSHGTHVAGTICAEGDNNHGITGMAWRCDLRFFAAGTTVAETASEMVDAVGDGARVVNMSLNYIENGNCAADPVVVERAAADANDVFERAVLMAQRENREVLWTLAAGNECGRDARFTAPGGLGARFPLDTLTVAAIGQDGRLASFSNAGPVVSVAAPGVDIYSTMPRIGCLFGRFLCIDTYGEQSGTSMATPQVAGLAGLVIAADPSRSAAVVKDCIVGSARRAGTAVPGQPFSTINAGAAVRTASVPCQGAATIAWTHPLDPDGEYIAHSDGSVTTVHVDCAQNNVYRTFDRDLDNAIELRSPGCGRFTQAGPAGIFYGSILDPATGQNHLTAMRADRILWSTPIPDYGCPENYPSTAYWLSPTANGDLHVVVDARDPDCTRRQTRFLGIDGRDGTVRTDQPVDMTSIPEAYAQGIVYSFADTLYRHSYTGDLVGTTPIGFPDLNWGDAAATIEGRYLSVLFRNDEPSEDCPSGAHQVVAAYDPSGLAWVTPLAVRCATVLDIQATPDGGVIVVATAYERESGSDRIHVTRYTPSGAVATTFKLDPDVAAARVAVDITGRYVVQKTLRSDLATYAELVVYSRTDQVESGFRVGGIGHNGRTFLFDDPWFGIRVTPNRVYLPTLRCDGSTQCTADLFAVDIPGLEGDYSRLPLVQ
ncbi:S8 family serine peptidase [Actinokineospora soli]|uniref:S8 family serine peptidase n=1 Tax=Actinokineospora soli TaxID=1048753 RepID=A0ABW2TVC8_9PSEU